MTSVLLAAVMLQGPLQQLPLPVRNALQTYMPPTTLEVAPEGLQRVSLGGSSGYHLVLRSPIHEPGGQQGASAKGAIHRGPPPKIIGYDYEEIILLSGSSDADVAGLPWKVLANRIHVRPLYLGESHGYRWFTRIPLGKVFFFSKIAELVGGPDLLALAVDGLKIDEPTLFTRHSCSGYLSRQGDDAIPYLRKAIYSNSEPHLAVEPLGKIETDESTNLLLEAYGLGQESIRSAVRSALHYEPYREPAKQIYLDMIQRRPSSAGAIKAAVKFNWSDAMPLLPTVIENDSRFDTQYEALKALRQLEGKGLTVEHEEAMRVLRSLESTARELQEARKILMTYDDKELIAYVALKMYTWITKPDTTLIRKTGLSILESLPGEIVRPMLHRVARTCDGPQGDEAKKLLSGMS